MVKSLQLFKSKKKAQWLLAMWTHQVVADTKVEQLELKVMNYLAKATRSDVRIAMVAMTQA